MLCKVASFSKLVLVIVYICEWPIWPCTAHRGPCIANSIYPPSLGLEEYTKITPLSWYQLGLLPPLLPFPELLPPPAFLPPWLPGRLPSPPTPSLLRSCPTTLSWRGYTVSPGSRGLPRRPCRRPWRARAGPCRCPHR
jgi:hypothetical protein